MSACNAPSAILIAGYAACGDHSDDAINAARAMGFADEPAPYTYLNCGAGEVFPATPQPSPPGVLIGMNAGTSSHPFWYTRRIPYTQEQP